MNIPTIRMNIGIVAGWLLATFSLQAQVAGGPAVPGGLSAKWTKLFGDVTAFSAKADIQVNDSAQQELASMPAGVAMLDTKVRMEMDLTQVKSKDIPPGTADTLKQMGMANMVTINRPDKKQTYLIYPDSKSILTMPLAKEDAEAAEKSVKVEKTAQGKETIDGHACVKNKVTITDDQGKPLEAVTWNATDLKDFPVQIQAKEKEHTVTVRFKQVQLAKPETSQFDPPTGYTTYTNQQEFMQGMMKKMMAETQGK